jgi:hypothetical protein
VVETVVNGWTAAADGLGLGDACLAGGVAFVWRVEESGGIHAPAGCSDLPFPVHREWFRQTRDVGHGYGSFRALFIVGEVSYVLAG